MVDLVGTSAGETLSGTGDQDTLSGVGGSDVLSGGADNDVLFGGDGQDTLIGGGEDDSLFGGAGSDLLSGDGDLTATSADTTTTSTNEPLTISLSVADVSNAVFEDVSGFVSRTGGVSGDINVAYVIDISGSMGGSFSGSTVGDTNGDGFANTLIDAVIASFSALNASLVDVGLGDATVALVPFESTAQIAFVGRADQDVNANGLVDIDEALTRLRETGSTSYEAALTAAGAFFQSAGAGDNHLIFISDGFPNNSFFTDEAELLRDPNGLDVEIRAIGLGNGASLSDLDLLDDGIVNNSAERVTDPALLDAGIANSGIDPVDIDRVEILVNGTVQTVIDADDLVETPFGLRFSAVASGLDILADDIVAARVVAVDGSSVTTTQTVEVAQSNTVGNDVLSGGRGNDTLDGNSGNDTADYSNETVPLSDPTVDFSPVSSFPTLFDGDGFEWDFLNGLTVLDGSNDAFDTALRLFSTVGGNVQEFLLPQSGAISADGRTLVAVGADGPVEIERRVHVPDDAAFARYLETFTNTGSATEAFVVEIDNNLGSDGATVLLQDSDGNLLLDGTDRFLVTDDGTTGGGDPAILEYFTDGAGQVAFFSNVVSGDTIFYQFGLELAPGESASILHFVAQSHDTGALADLAADLDDGDPDLFVGLSAEEAARVVNFDLTGIVLDGTEVRPVDVDLSTGLATDPFGDTDRLFSIENVIGTDADDTLTGDASANELTGLAGDDTLTGGAGDDILDGGDGDDLLVGEGGLDATSSNTTTTTNNEPLTISLTLADASASESEVATGFVSRTEAVGQSVNAAFVIDVSGSMSNPFAGSSVGDLNGDGQANTLLDAVIASFSALNLSLVDAGLSDANIVLIPFDDTAQAVFSGTAGFDGDQDGQPDVLAALTALQVGGNTSFDAALASAITFFQGAPAGDNNVFFISDGFPNGGPFDDESAILRDSSGINATIRAIGLGSSASLTDLDLLDDGVANNSAERVLDPGQLDAGLQGSGVDVAEIDRVELLVDGTVVQTVAAGDLVSTPFGLRFSAQLTGLDAGAAETVTARVIATDGSRAATSQVLEVLSGDASGDDTLLGGDGADTLRGEDGNDFGAGGDGDDFIFGGEGSDDLAGGGGADFLDGGDGADLLRGDGNVAATSSASTTTTTSEPLTVSLTMADVSDNETELVSGFVSRTETVSDVLNIAYVIDVSGSMSDPFQGSSVGDLNGDGQSDTLLDAVIAAFTSLNQSLVDAGLGQANVTVIPFADSALQVFTGRAGQDSDGNGRADVVDQLSVLSASGGTDYEAGLQSAIAFFENGGGGDNHVFFISDGFPNGGPFADDAAVLRDSAGIDASIRAVGLGAGASLSDLDRLDDGLANSSAERVLDPAALDAGLQDSGVAGDDVDRIEILVNGNLQTTVAAADLVSTPFGLRFSATVTGLQAGADDIVTARLIAGDGTQLETSQTLEQGNGQGAGDDTIVGSGGDDTILGEAGDDSLFGGDGADLITGGGGDDRMTGGDGGDLYTFSIGDGHDTVADFDPAADRLDLTAFDLFDLDDVLAIAEEFATPDFLGSDPPGLLITLSPDQSVTLENINLLDLTTDNLVLSTRPGPGFGADRQLGVADFDWHYSGRSADNTRGDPASYDAQDWSAPDIVRLGGGQTGATLRVGDVTGDGIADLVAVGGNDLLILDGDDGSVTQVPALSHTGISPILADLDGDSDLEILVGSAGTADLQVSIFDGDGSLLHTLSGPSGGSDTDNLAMVPVAYLGNGRLAVSFRSGFDLDPRGLAVYDINTGTEEFLFDTGPEVTGVSVFEDLGVVSLPDTFFQLPVSFGLDIFTPENGATGAGTDGNGTPTSDSRSTVIVVGESGDEELVADIRLSGGGLTDGAVETVLVDLEFDGNAEIVVGVGHTAQHPGLSEIQVQDISGTVLHRATTVPDAAMNLRVADMDRDGDQEILVSHSNGDLFLFDHDLTVLASATHPNLFVSALADIDGDGGLEVIGFDSTGIRILSGDDLTQDGAAITLPGGAVTSVITTDFDGDGRADLLAGTEDVGIFQIQGQEAVIPDPVITVVPAIDAVIAGAGETVTISAVYDNSLDDETTTGLGLRLHFDSSIFSFTGLENLFQTSLQPFGLVAEADSSDFDGDTSTDSFVAINWADFGQNWPGPGNVPLTLFDAGFTVSGTPDDAVFNFSVSSAPAGFDFEGSGFRFFEDRWPLPDQVLIAENAADGALVSDLAPTVIDPTDPGTFTLVDDAGGRFRLDGFSLQVADGDLIDFETATSHQVTIRITNNAGATVDRDLTVQVEDVAEQIVEPLTDGAILATGDSVRISANYRTADPVDPTLSGLGLRLHFDSTSLSFDGFANLFTTALQPFGQIVEADVSDFDGDAATDSFIAVNWADFSQNWPGTDSQLLYDALFTSLDGGDAVVNFTASSTAAGRVFSGQSFIVVGDRWDLPSTVSVAENSSGGSVVADLTPALVDPDDPGTYTLLDDAGGRFVLDGFSLKVATGADLDFEAVSSHTVELRITSDTGAVAERVLTVNLTDVNEAPETVVLDVSAVAEGAAAGTVVGTLSGDDPEGDALTFTLLDDAGGRFALNGDQLVVADGDLLDFESATSHAVRVEARDPSGLTLEELLTIDVTDVAEATLDLDGNGVADALSDGLIALGRMFGAPVAQLSGFAQPGSPGSDPVELEARLQEAEAGFFDVDGNGTTDALSDGLMILGFLFGAPSQQLAGFADPGGTRSSAGDIATFLDSVLPQDLAA